MYSLYVMMLSLREPIDDIVTVYRFGGSGAASDELIMVWIWTDIAKLPCVCTSTRL